MSNEKWISELKRRITGILAEVVVIEAGDHTSLPFVHRRHDGIDFAYDFPVLGKIEDAISHICTNSVWGDRVSVNYSCEQLFEVIRALLSDSTRTDERIHEFLEAFPKAIKRHVVYVPLFGVSIERGATPWRVGNVDLFNVTAELIDIFCYQTHEIFAEMLRSSLEPGTYAVYEVEAEPERAKELAFEETRRVVDLLRFSVTLKPELVRGRVVIALEEEINLKPDNRLITVIPYEFTGLEVHWRANVSEHGDWVLTKDLIKDLNSYGFDRVSSILAKPYSQVTEFEKALVRSIHWVANYQFQFEAENKLLSLITTLETLLTPRDGNPIGTAIAEAVAIICSNDLQERKMIKKRVKHLYRHRSAVSHGGHTAIVQSELEDLFKLTQQTVLWMIKSADKFVSLTNVFEWIEDQRLGTGEAIT